MNNEAHLDYAGYCADLSIYVTPGCRWTVEWGDLSKQYTGTGDWQFISHAYTDGYLSGCIHVFADDGGEIIGIDAGGMLWSECSWSNIDVSRCPSLRYFRNNRAEAIDVSCNPLLKELECKNGTFKTLDLSANPNLEKLTCTWCKDLTALNLSRNLALRELNIIYSGIKRVGLHNRTALQRVVMEEVELDERSEKYMLQILERNDGELKKITMHDP